MMCCSSQSNVTNVTYVVVGAVVVEMLYGMVGDSIFDMANKGVSHPLSPFSKSCYVCVLKQTLGFIGHISTSRG